MKSIKWHLPLCLALLLSAAPVPVLPQNAPDRGRWPQAIVDDPEQAERRQLLVSHGILPQPDSLIRFLREGFPPPAPGQRENLPSQPRRKVEVVDAAIQELGVTGATAAVPVLIEIVERRGPAGVTAILRRDVEDLPLDSADGQILIARRVLSLNAIVALGIIGDSRAEEPILQVMRTERATAFVTRGAEALALMGSPAGIPSVVRLAEDVNSDDSVAAFRTIFVVTGRNYGYTANTAIARRRQLVGELRLWSESPAASEAPSRADVLRRLETVPAPTPLDPTSLRGLLRASMDLGRNTRDDFDRRLEARRQLSELAPRRFDELKVIAEDVREDLDIRRAAIRWLAVGNPRRARGILRKLRKDENAIIGETVRTVEQDIPEYIENQRREGGV